MNGQIGGFRNMLRRWRINLKLLKKKHPKTTGFVYKAIAIFIMPIGYFFQKVQPSKKNIKNEKNIKDEKNKKEEINNNIQEEVKKNSDSKKSDLEIKIDEKLPSNINPNEKNNLNNKNNDLENIEIKKKSSKEIDNTIKNLIILSPLLFFKDKLTPQKKDSIKNAKLKCNKIIEENVSSNIKIKKNIETLDDKLNKIEIEIKNIIDNIIDLDIEEVKEKLKFYEEELKLIEEKNKLHDEQKEKIDKIKENINNCFVFYNILEIEKNKETSLKIETEKNNKENYKKIDDIMISKKIILEKIAEQQNYLKGYIIKLNNSNNYKFTVYESVIYFLNKTTNSNIFWLSFIFKSPLLNYLLGAILLNNSVKSIKYIVNPKTKIDYKKITDDFVNSVNITETIENCCNETLKDLKIIRTDIYNMQINDNKILSQLNKIEEMVNNQLNVLNENKIKLNKIKILKRTNF